MDGSDSSAQHPVHRTARLDAGSPVDPQPEGRRVDHPESLHHERRFGDRLQANPLALPLDVLPVESRIKQA